MLCQSYEEMTPKERQEFIGKLVHLVQSNQVYFDMADRIIFEGEDSGDLQGVTFDAKEMEESR